MFRAHVLIVRRTKIVLYSLWYHHTYTGRTPSGPMAWTLPSSLSTAGFYYSGNTIHHTASYRKIISAVLVSHPQLPPISFRWGRYHSMLSLRGRIVRLAHHRRTLQRACADSHIGLFLHSTTGHIAIRHRRGNLCCYMQESPSRFPCFQISPCHFLGNFEF